MNNATAPAYAAEVTGSNGQVVARFRVKTIKYERYNGEVLDLPVAGVSAQFPELLIADYCGSSYLFDASAKMVYGGFQWGTGSIYHSRPVQVSETTGRVITRIGIASGQIKSQHAQFCGLWTANMDKANDITREHRARSGSRTTEEKKEIRSANVAAKIAKYAGKIERAEKRLATVAANNAKRYEAAKRKLEKAGKPAVFNNGVRDIDAILLEAFGMYAEPGTASLESVTEWDLAETAHKLSAYRKGQEPTQYTNK